MQKGTFSTGKLLLSRDVDERERERERESDCARRRAQ